jgi:hypothetical protein
VAIDTFRPIAALRAFGATAPADCTAFCMATAQLVARCAVEPSRSSNQHVIASPANPTTAPRRPSTASINAV